eukprot:7427198-Prorocentrum_lima.AAC.1
MAAAQPGYEVGCGLHSLRWRLGMQRVGILESCPAGGGIFQATLGPMEKQHGSKGLPSFTPDILL